MNSVVRAHLFLLLTTLIGGFNYSISKIVMPSFLSPATIIVSRGIGATLFFWLIERLFIKEKIQSKKDYLNLFICAIFGISANQVLFYEGLNKTTPINASLLQCGVPIFVMIISFFMAREKITFLKVLGLISGAAGALLLLISSSRNNIEGSHIGDILVIFNAASYAVFLVMVQPLTEKYDPFTVVKWIFFFGTLMNIPYGFNEFVNTQWSTFPYYTWFCFGFIIVFATIVNYYLNVGVLRYVNPSVAGIYVYLQPVFATIIAVAWGKDSITFDKIGYSLLIFAGIFLVSRKSKKKHTSKVKTESLSGDL